MYLLLLLLLLLLIIICLLRAKFKTEDEGVWISSRSRWLLLGLSSLDSTDLKGTACSLMQTNLDCN